MEPLFRQEPPVVPINLSTATPRRLRWLAAEKPKGRPTAAQPYGYESFDDPVELGIAIRELNRVHSWIGQFADIAAEMPGFAPESVVGAKATAAMVSLLIDRAEARLRYLTSQHRITPGGAGAAAAG